MVAMEAVKQESNRGEDVSLYFFRDQNGSDLDLILERDRKFTPIEIKCSTTWNTDFAKQIPWFQALAPRAGSGVEIYGGDNSFGLLLLALLRLYSANTREVCLGFVQRVLVLRLELAHVLLIERHELGVVHRVKVHGPARSA